MPFYAYDCNACKKTFKVFHSADELEQTCIICKSTSITKKIPTLTVSSPSKKDSAGARVEKFIEESREVLQEQMRESRKDYK